MEIPNDRGLKDTLQLRTLESPDEPVLFHDVKRLSLVEGQLVAWLKDGGEVLGFNPRALLSWRWF